jgi:hypothetical protein
MIKSDDETNHIDSMKPSVPKKSRVTLYLDPSVIAAFRAQAVLRQSKYQTLINDALRQTMAPEATPLTIDALRRVLREELSRRQINRQPQSEN